MVTRLNLRPLALVAACLLAGCATQVPSPNLGTYKHDLVRWFDSGGYSRAFADSAKRGRQAVAAASQGPSRTHPAIVLDIDETALSNWAYLRQHDFGTSVNSFREWVEARNDPALAPVQQIFRQARAANIPVFFITGRREPLRAATIRQLRAAGYDGWAHLYLKPVDYKLPSVSTYKTACRKEIEAQGYTIILNMGDQWSDLEGGVARTAVKLPNPFYFIR